MLRLKSLGFLLLLVAELIWGQAAQVPLYGNEPSLPNLRLAVVGAGAAGSSFAYHIARKLNRLDTGIGVNITIFDPKPRAGGRTTTVNALGLSSQPVEAGASIFVKINQILYNATRDLDLVTDEAFYDRPRAGKYGLGVWDGRKFVFKQASDAEGDDESSKKNRRYRSGVDWKGWWDIAKLLWRYGLAPIRTQSATKDAIGRFLRMYEEPMFPFHNLTDTVRNVGLIKYTGSSGQDLLTANGVGEAFQREVIQASTRVNYAQNLDQIHSLEVLACMSIDGAVSVQGGNWQIFDKMIQVSGADFRRNTTVTAVKMNHDRTYTLHSEKASSAHGAPTDRQAQDEFDTVIIAAPYHSANLEIDPTPSAVPMVVPYVNLHVSLFTSPHLISPAYFNLSHPSDVPSMILTTLPSSHKNHHSIAPETSHPGPAGFWSISTLRAIQQPGQRRQYLYKIFSPDRLNGTYLSSLLGIRNHQKNSSNESIADLAAQQPHDLTWIHEQTWQSYPYLTPRTTFDSINLGMGNGRPGSGIYYTGGMEPFISTMETSALMGRNVAQLIVDEITRTPALDQPWLFNQ